MDAEEQREHQRKRVKQRYHETLRSLSQARDLVLQLTEQHRRLVEQQQTTHGHRDQALGRYADAIALADELRQEKQRLLELIQKREKLQDRLMTLLCENARDQAQPSSEDSSADPLISFRPLNVSDCEQITRSSVADIQRFMTRDSYVSTNASVLEWRDKRVMADGVIRMTLEKTLESFTPFDLALRTWQLLHGKPEYADLFSPSLKITIRCLQVVNDANMIMVNHFSNVAGNLLFHAVYLASFVKIDDGYAVLFQAFDRQQFDFKNTVESEGQWLDINSCYLFRTNEVMDSKSDVHVGGKMADLSAQVTRTWMLEQLLVCLRWENRVVGTRALV